MVKISVLMAVRNESRWLREALNSVTNQTHTDLEILVIDDRSTDDTRDIAKQFAARDDARVIVESSNGAGKVAAYNHAFERASGDLFCFFAGDDVLPVNSIAARSLPLSPYFRSSVPSLSICGYEMLSVEPRFHGTVRVPADQSGRISLFSGGLVMFNRAFAEQLFPVPEHYPSEDTLAYYLALYGDARIFNIPHVEYLYRLHEGNSYAHNASHEKLSARFALDVDVLEAARSRLGDRLADGPQLEARLKCSELSRSGKAFSCILCENVPLRTRVKYALQARPRVYDAYAIASSWLGRK